MYFFSVVPKIVNIIVFFRVFFFIFHPWYSLGSMSYYFIILLVSCSMFSIWIGSLGALYERKFKRLIAYSSIVNMGYIVLAASSGGAYWGIYASFYYLGIYIFGVKII